MGDDVANDVLPGDRPHAEEVVSVGEPHDDPPRSPISERVLPRQLDGSPSVVESHLVDLEAAVRDAVAPLVPRETDVVERVAGHRKLLLARG